MAKQMYRKHDCRRDDRYYAVQSQWEQLLTCADRRGYTMGGYSDYGMYEDQSGYGEWQVWGHTSIPDDDGGVFYTLEENDPQSVYRYRLYFAGASGEDLLPVFDLERRKITNNKTVSYTIDKDSDLGVVLTEDGAYPDSDIGYTFETTLPDDYIIMLDDATYYAYSKIANSSVFGSTGTLGVANELVLTSHCDSLTHVLVATCGTETLSVGENIVDGNITWTPPVEWAAQNVKGTTVSVSVTCEIYLNTTLVDSVLCSLLFSIPDDLVPTVDLSVVDSMGLLDVYGGYIQNVSRATVDVTAEGVYGSTIKEYRVICGSLSSAASMTTFALPNAGETVVTVTVLDTRGRSASASTTINVLEYAAPICAISACYRSDASGASDRHGDYAAVIFNASVTPINDQNSAWYVLGYRIAGTTVWSTSGNTWAYISLDDLDDQYDVSDHIQLVQVESNNVYEFCVFVSDDIRTDIGSNVMALSTNDIIMHVDRSRMAIGIHKVADQDNSVDFGLPVFGEFYGTFEAQFRPKRVITDSVDFDELTTTGIYTGHITEHLSSPRQNCYISLEVTNISYTTDSYAVHQKAVTIGRNDITLVYERVYTSANGWSEWTEIVGATAHEHTEDVTMMDSIYEPFDSSSHRINYFCSCGIETVDAVFEEHTMADDSCEPYDENEHTKNGVCVDCGYYASINEPHVMTSPEYVYIDKNNHAVNAMCSVCGCVSSTSESHLSVTVAYHPTASDGNTADDTGHYVDYTYCDKCGGTLDYSYTEDHSLIKAPQSGVLYCEYCGWVSS